MTDEYLPDWNNGKVPFADPAPPRNVGFFAVGPQMNKEQRFQVSMGKLAKGSFPLELGVIRATLWGGPYYSKPADMYGIKMAEEIKNDCVISIPTRDFDVPDVGRFVAGLYAGITLAHQGYPIWVGCMGGIGRTGLYFGGLAKVMAGYQRMSGLPVIHPVGFVRQKYYGHAIETQDQIRFIEDLDVTGLVKWVMSLQPNRKWYTRLFDFDKRK